MSPSHHNNPTTSHVNISPPHHLNLFIILKIVAQGACHRRVFLCRRLEVESVSGVGYCLGCSRSECGDAHVVLLEAGEAEILAHAASVSCGLVSVNSSYCPSGKGFAFCVVCALAANAREHKRTEKLIFFIINLF